MKNIKIIIALLLFVVLVCIFFYIDLQKTEEPQNDVNLRSEVSIRLKWLHQAQFAGFYFAEKAGLYNKENIDVTLLPGGPDFPAINLVVSGADDFGVVGADQLLTARSKGVPVVALAAIYKESPGVLFSLSDSNIKTLSDIKGKRVGVKYGTGIEMIYRAMLAQEGLSSKDVEEIPVKFDLSSFFSGDIDVWPGYAINEPIIAKEKGYEITLLFPSDYGVNIYADVLFTTEDMITKEPELVRKVVQATMQGWEQSLNKKEQAVTYTLQYSDSLKRDHEQTMLEASERYIKPNSTTKIGEMNKETWEHIQKLLVGSGLIDAPIDVEYAYTNIFLQ